MFVFESILIYWPLCGCLPNYVRTHITMYTRKRIQETNSGTDFIAGPRAFMRHPRITRYTCICALIDSYFTSFLLMLQEPLYSLKSIVWFHQSGLGIILLNIPFPSYFLKRHCTTLVTHSLLVIH